MPRVPPTQRWLMMGVELEGGWDRRPRDIAAAVNGAESKEDGSVRVDNRAYKGEIVTKPHKLLDALCKDIEALHPDEGNATCGYHIHTSFSVMDTSSLASEAFWKFFHDEWDVWFQENSAAMTPEERERFLARKNGSSDGRRSTGESFCKREFKPVEQFTEQRDRYTQLNFLAWHKYKTIECRMLPMFNTKAITVSATRKLAEIYDTFLNEHAKDEVVTLDTVFETGEDGVLVTSEACELPEGYDGSVLVFDEEGRSIERVIHGEDIHYQVEGVPEASGFMYRRPIPGL